MTRIYRLGRFACAVGYHIGAPGGWECAVDVILGWRPRVICTTVGFGFDTFAPLRPWPKIWIRRRSPKGRSLTGFAWCGLFVNVDGL